MTDFLISRLGLKLSFLSFGLSIPSSIRVIASTEFKISSFNLKKLMIFQNGFWSNYSECELLEMNILFYLNLSSTWTFTHMGFQRRNTLGKIHCSSLIGQTISFTTSYRGRHCPTTVETRYVVAIWCLM